jgi:hypothetical protein
MMSSFFQNIALYGTGSDKIGHPHLDALLEVSHFKITVLVPTSSTTNCSANVTVAQIPSNPPSEDLVQALKGQGVPRIRCRVSITENLLKVRSYFLAVCEISVSRVFRSKFAVAAFCLQHW